MQAPRQDNNISSKPTGFSPGESDLDAMIDKAKNATDFLKALAHEGRLMILCRLIESECSVAELEELLSARQSAVSQQLARLRVEGLVKTRRDGKAIYYSIADKRIEAMVQLIYQLFCEDDNFSQSGG